MLEERPRLSSQVLALEEQITTWKKKHKELEDIIQRRNDSIHKLKANMKLEKFKNKFYKFIISSNTTIKISDIFREEEDGLHLYNYERGNVSVFYHDEFKGGTDPEINILKIPAKVNQEKKKVFRAIKASKLVEEKPEDQEEMLKIAENKIDEFTQAHHLNVSLKEITGNINNYFSDMEKARAYKKILTGIKENRNKLLGKLSFDEYIVLINTHVKRLQDVFNKKKHDQKKILINISMSLSPLDQRLIYYHQYYNTLIEPDEIQKLKLALKANIKFPKRFIPFSLADLCNRLSNYSISIFTIKENLKRVLVSPFTFPNLVYLNIPKDYKESSKESPDTGTEVKKAKVVCDTDDPFRFYILEKVDGEKRCWKMECRLYDFCNTISDRMKTFCITLFRKVYMDIFKDNVYRENYKDVPIAGQDCQQLLVNLIAFSKPRALCEVVRNIIVKNCSIQPSRVDKFNFTADDKINKRLFNSQEDKDEEITASFKRLFDGLSDEDAYRLWSEKIDY